MLKNTVKIFSASTTSHIHPPIDSQINLYLDQHKDYRIVDVSYMLAGIYEKALVVFSYYVPDERDNNLKTEGSKVDIRKKIEKTS